MAKKSEHSEALELIGYGLSKFAGNKLKVNLFANALAKNRSAFFNYLVDINIATTSNAVSTRQDNYDYFFENSKKGFTDSATVSKYEKVKKRIDAVVGSLSMEEYVQFTKQLIAYELGENVLPESVALIEMAKKSVFEKEYKGYRLEKDNNVDDIDDSNEVQSINTDDENLHTEIQWILIQIGKATGCDVFVATNDRSRRKYQGHTLGEYSIESLPAKGIDVDTLKIIELIDVVWVKNGLIVCAFEVECTTSVASGILRISDMMYSDPYNKIQGYIVAPSNRSKKVMKELSRPTFNNSCWEGVIKYITTEDLKELYERLGCIKFTPGVLDVQIVEGYATSIGQEK